jgi:hypothetical protein
MADKDLEKKHLAIKAKLQARLDAFDGTRTITSKKLPGEKSEKEKKE